MIDFELAKHAIEQIKLRGIPTDLVEAVLHNPDTIIEEIDGQKIYQSIIQEIKKIIYYESFLTVTKIRTYLRRFI